MDLFNTGLPTELPLEFTDLNIKSPTKMPTAIKDSCMLMFTKDKYTYTKFVSDLEDPVADGLVNSLKLDDDGYYLWDALKNDLAIYVSDCKTGEELACILNQVELYFGVNCLGSSKKAYYALYEKIFKSKERSVILKFFTNGKLPSIDEFSVNYAAGVYDKEIMEHRVHHFYKNIDKIDGYLKEIAKRERENGMPLTQEQTDELYELMRENRENKLLNKI